MSSGVEGLNEDLKAILEHLHPGLVVGSELRVLFDSPPGIALYAVSTLTVDRAVVVTGSFCPEYIEDLWSFKPAVLLAGAVRLDEVVAAISGVVEGERFRKIPDTESKLTGRERDVLRCCAMGFDNREIASLLHVSDNTAKNAMSRVFTKLGLRNRAEATLYYWGQWHLLRRARGYKIGP